MSDIQKEMFDNDLDPIVMKLDVLDQAKNAFMQLGKHDDTKHTRTSYQKSFNQFQVLYNTLSDSDKREFEQWKEENGFDW